MAEWQKRGNLKGPKGDKGDQPEIAAKSITGDKIADKAIDGSKFKVMPLGGGPFQLLTVVASEGSSINGSMSYAVAGDGISYNSSALYGSLSIADGGVSEAKLADGAVGLAKLKPSTNGAASNTVLVARSGDGDDAGFTGVYPGSGLAFTVGTKSASIDLQAATTSMRGGVRQAKNVTAFAAGTSPSNQTLATQFTALVASLRAAGILSTAATADETQDDSAEHPADGV